MIKEPKDLRVFVSRDFPDIGIELIKQEGFQVKQWTSPTPLTIDELIAELQNHDVLFGASNDKLDASFFNQCQHLLMISQFSAGYDNIDLEAANQYNIPIGNAPGAMKNATADVAFGLMIAVSRKMFHMHKKIEKGQWGYFQPKADLGQELNGKTLGVFGLGQIGFEMARKCKGGFDMEIIYCNRSRNKRAEQQLGARYVSFDELLAESDVLSVHAALSEETRHRFNSTAFNRMRSSAIFINTSRGGLHHEKDLIEALRNGQIWGVGLDVTDPEPMRRDHPLLSMENACVLPHIGSATIEARDEMSRLAAQNIISYFKGEGIPNLVNPEALANT